MNKHEAILIKRDEDEEDDFGWRPLADGRFNSKSAYDLALGPTSVLLGVIWKQIWTLKVPQRVRTLMWVIQHGRLLTNVERFRRGFHKIHYFRVCSFSYETPKKDYSLPW